MNDNRTYALCSALFFAVLAWGLITFGGNEVKLWAFLSLLFGGMSQFFMQDRVTVWPGIISTYIGLLFAVVAVLEFWVAL